MSIAYLDCFNGAAGDMIVAALLDAGADAERLRHDLSSLPLEGYTLEIAKVKKQGFAATRFVVHLEARAQPHRHLKDVLHILEHANLPEAIMEKASRVFMRLAVAEAAVHGTTTDKVHFHEVGAVDAIIDVVAALLALDQLAIETIICSPVPVGSGTVRCDHGVMPVPAPAVAELLKGVPLAATDEPGELTTPTGAALLTSLAQTYGPCPEMTPRAVGYGAGTRDGQTRPNVLRVLVGEANSEGAIDEVVVLEANLDDTTPEVIGYCLERLLAEGALDAYAVPIHMKKSRAAVLLTALCTADKADQMEHLMLMETTTFGVRRHSARRSKLVRRHDSVSTPFGTVRIKVGEGRGVVTAAPEFEDCRALAAARGVALREVMIAAQVAWANRETGGSAS